MTSVTLTRSDDARNMHRYLDSIRISGVDRSGHTNSRWPALLRTVDTPKILMLPLQVGPPAGEVEDAGGPVHFVRAWLDHEGAVSSWERKKEKARGLSLFQRETIQITVTLTWTRVVDN
jgi:hypothetical protein